MSAAPRWDADTAVDELYAVHYRRLVRLSVLLVHDVETAEEVVQDSFVAMHGRWRTLRDPDSGLDPVDRKTLGETIVKIGFASDRLDRSADASDPERVLRYFHEFQQGVEQLQAIFPPAPK